MKNIKVIKSYESFNQRRYSNPWVAIIDPETGDPELIKQGRKTSFDTIKMRSANCTKVSKGGQKA